ncbi:MAG: ATP synthase F1 subunit delta [Alphaproteobacteria bacterium]|nr:ATP synthase F1 subunit delta [Alphaproteobacteria bacterium]
MRKVSKTKIAHVYATALYEASLERNSIETVKKDVAKLHGLLSESNDFGDYLENPLWSQKDKCDVLQKTAKLLNLSDETLSCLNVVVENGRISDLNLILSDFEKICNCKSNIVKVNVETVKKLSSIQSNKLKKIMEKILGKQVEIDYVLNPKILGGLRVQCGSKMFDDSLASKLNYLENIMKGK